MKNKQLLLIPALSFVALFAASSANADNASGAGTKLWLENVGTGCAVGAVFGGLKGTIDRDYKSAAKNAAIGCAVVGTVAGAIEARMLDTVETPSEEDLSRNSLQSDE
jgi:hydroxyethylthiazole kinase-like sugar kinase family protein